MTWSLEWLLCNLARHDVDLSRHGNPFLWRDDIDFGWGADLLVGIITQRGFPIITLLSVCVTGC
jgi:hypothetical protein